MNAKKPTFHRISFEQLNVERLAGSRFSVQVELAWQDRGVHVGKAEGRGSQVALLECAATATMRALQSAVDQRVEFELLEIIELADSNSVTVLLSLSKTGGGRVWKFCGTCLVDDEPGRAAVKAVLKATNRLFENGFIFLLLQDPERRTRLDGTG